MLQVNEIPLDEWNSQYDIDEEYYRPYLEQNSVLEGFFEFLHKMFNIKFTKTNAKAWDEKVQVYNLNEYVALGAGLQYKFLKQKDFYTSHLYGASAIGLLNPIPEIQLSAEVEQLRVNLRFDGNTAPPENFWNTALFVGVGYRSGNATVGVRYNVIEDKNNLYGSAFMPFVRFYF